jgi:hypothetical protein
MSAGHTDNMDYCVDTDSCFFSALKHFLILAVQEPDIGFPHNDMDMDRRI